MKDKQAPLYTYFTTGKKKQTKDKRFFKWEDVLKKRQDILTVTEKKNTRKILQLKLNPPYLNYSWNSGCPSVHKNTLECIILIHWEVKIIKWQIANGGLLSESCVTEQDWKCQIC